MAKQSNIPQQVNEQVVRYQHNIVKLEQFIDVMLYRESRYHRNTVNWIKHERKKNRLYEWSAEIAQESHLVVGFFIALVSLLVYQLSCYGESNV